MTTTKETNLVRTKIGKMVKEFIMEKFGTDEDEITDNAHFVNDLGLDSLDTVELILGIEEIFSISIPDDIAAGFNTVGEAIEWLEKNVKTAR